MAKIKIPIGIENFLQIQLQSYMNEYFEDYETVVCYGQLFIARAV